jgi:Flp pilus assembly protein TadG
MLVELSLIFLTFVMLTVGIMDWGQCLWAYSTLSRATTAVARCAAISENLTDASYPSKCPDYVAFANSAAFPFATIQFAVTPVANCGTSVAGLQSGAMKVTATFTYTFRIVPYILGPYTETACFTKQQ